MEVTLRYYAEFILAFTEAYTSNWLNIANRVIQKKNTPVYENGNIYGAENILY